MCSPARSHTASRPTRALICLTVTLLGPAAACRAAAQPVVRNEAGLALMADSTEAGPALLLQLPDASIGRRSIRVLAPEHATVREVGATDARQLFRYDRVKVTWVRQGRALAYRHELLPGLTLDVTATLDPDGVRVRYAYTNRTSTAYALMYAPTDPRLTGPFHDVRLERTWVHRAGGFALLASDLPQRLTLPLDRWLPARVLNAYTWPVPAEKVRREGGITYYNAAQPVDEPMLSTVTADGRWTVTSFTATAGNVWSNPELTCQHVDPTPPLPARATAVVETKLLVTRGTLADALRAVRAQRPRMATGVRAAQDGAAAGARE
jgi:hypothetical protein